MPVPVVIENPVLNSPFEEPTRHFRFGDTGITDQVVEARRPSVHIMSVAQLRKKGRQLTLDPAWADESKENAEINYMRQRVKFWRDTGYKNITPVTHNLLAYWRRPGRERRLFNCQVEALETPIFLAEAAYPSGDVSILNKLAEAQEMAGTTLPRSPARWPPGAARRA